MTAARRLPVVTLLSSEACTPAFRDETPQCTLHMRPNSCHASNSQPSFSRPVGVHAPDVLKHSVLTRIPFPRCEINFAVAFSSSAYLVWATARQRKGWKTMCDSTDAWFVGCCAGILEYTHHPEWEGAPRLAVFPPTGVSVGNHVHPFTVTRRPSGSLSYCC